MSEIDFKFTLHIERFNKMNDELDKLPKLDINQHNIDNNLMIENNQFYPRKKQGHDLEQKYYIIMNLLQIGLDIIEDSSICKINHR